MSPPTAGPVGHARAAPLSQAEAALNAEAVDVLVVGAGNAALCAALSAREMGASVAVLECAPREESGGNSTFTAGAMRVAYAGVDELRALMPDLTAKDLGCTDFGTYTEEEFFNDMARTTQYRADPDLVEQLVKRSYDTLQWMRTWGVRFAPIYGRQAYKIDGQFKFWGGLTVEAVGGGVGLIEALTASCQREGIQILYETRATQLIMDDARVIGARVRYGGRPRDVHAKAVVLASGGFQANAEWRTRYLGPGWDVAKVRGTRFNYGDGIRMALEAGASPAGNWSGCHAVAWDMNSPEFGDLAVGDGFQKHSYPLGIMINNRGERFVDEGADFRNFTYAKYGHDVLRQPGQVAWQLFDNRVSHLLRDEYRIREVTSVTAATLTGLARKMEGVDEARFLRTVEQYNASVDKDTPFDPNMKDGRGTNGLALPKTNWANEIDQPPFIAFQVTCGITFTFGGLRITPAGQVLDLDHKSMAGLYACGELVGGLFYFNYPGGSGLTSGAVFGRIAGAAAAKYTGNL